MADQFKQIRILLAQDRFMAILEQMSDAAVTAIEIHRIAGQQPFQPKSRFSRSNASESGDRR
jgi:hypothetical protein